MLILQIPIVRIESNGHHFIGIGCTISNIHAIFIFLKCTHAMKDRTTMSRKVAARIISVRSSVISSDDSDDDDRSSSEWWLPKSYTEDWATLSPEEEWIESKTGTHLNTYKSVFQFKCFQSIQAWVFVFLHHMCSWCHCHRDNTAAETWWSAPFNLNLAILYFSWANGDVPWSAVASSVPCVVCSLTSDQRTRRDSTHHNKHRENRV